MNFKIGVISDTHLGGLTREFNRIYNEFLADKDLILHAGDIVSAEIVGFLERKNFHGVHGNMDPLEVKEMLPAKKILKLGPYRLGLAHGGGPSAGLEERICSEFRGHDVDIIVYGHSHHAVNHVREGVLLFNPGTATGFSSSGIQSIGILELDDTIHGEIIRL
jgi:putative phosphoesterase